MNDEPEIRRRNATATRRAILDSARKVFVRLGYEGAGVREIAAGANVTAMLINRYFGSKEALFAEVVGEIMGGPRILNRDFMKLPDAGRRLAEAVVQITAADASPLDGFQIIIRSANSASAVEIGRAEIEANHQRAVAEELGGQHGAQRAAIILSLISGLQTMRQGIGSTALKQADPQVLVDLLAPLFQALIDGE